MDNTGNIDRKLFTPLEKEWFDTEKGFTISSRRSYFYDPENMMYYWPVEYEKFPIVTTKSFTVPTDEWILENGLHRVLGVSNTSPSREFSPINKEQMDICYIADDVVFDILSEFESEIAFGDLIYPIATDKSKDQWEKVAEILSHPVIGNPLNRRYLTPEFIKDKFIDVLEKLFYFRDYTYWRLRYIKFIHLVLNG